MVSQGRPERQLWGAGKVKNVAKYAVHIRAVTVHRSLELSCRNEINPCVAVTAM
jgi:hypothetical protein